MGNIENQYLNLLKDILENGVKKEDRTGTGTISVFGRQIRHKMSDGFPLITTKKMYWNGIVTELLWFLRGDTNIKYLVDNNCHIWDGDTYKNYEKKVPLEYVVGSDSDTMQYNMVWNKKTDHLSGYPIFERLPKEEFIEKIKTDNEFANKWGDLGSIYGKQWRDWKGFKQGWNSLAAYEFDTKGIDQIQNLINDIKTNPDSRRLMVNAWNVGELENMILPPCHYGFQVYTRELTTKERMQLSIEYSNKHNLFPLNWRVNANGFMYDEIEKTIDNSGWNIPKRAISLMWNQRSVDTPLGLPFNIASYALLLEILGRIVNMVPDELIGNLGDCHIYLNQIDGVKEQLTREPYELPKLVHMKTDTYYGNLSESLTLINDLNPNDFQIENYESHKTIKIPLSN